MQCYTTTSTSPARTQAPLIPTLFSTAPPSIAGFYDTDSVVIDGDQKSNSCARDEDNTDVEGSQYKTNTVTGLQASRRVIQAVKPNALPDLQHTERPFNPSRSTIVISFQQQ